MNTLINIIVISSVIMCISMTNSITGITMIITIPRQQSPASPAPLPAAGSGGDVCVSL